MPTLFQERVYRALEKIPKGRVTTYGAIARYLGTKAVRAVATAVAKNQNAPSIPCHRVVPSSGQIGNYSGPGGVAGKVKLLAEEGVDVKEGYIVEYEQHLYCFDNEDESG